MAKGGNFMKLKLDDNGAAVLQDGKPVYVHDDGKEVTVDAKEIYAKMAELREESQTKRLAFQQVTDKLKAFEGVDIEKAKAALETVSKLDQSKLIDIGKVEEVQKQYVDQIAELKDGYEVKLTEKDGVIGKKTADFANLLIRQAFSSSPMLKKLNETIPPDMLFNTFGKNFQVEEIEGNPVVIGYHNGVKIPSRENPAGLPGFEEALEFVIDKYPGKNTIFGGTGSGSGGKGNQDGSGIKMTPEQISKLSVTEYETAKKEGKIAGVAST
jgi:hypothetical protein